MTSEKMQAIIEAALMVAGTPLSILSLQNLFADDERPTNPEVKTILAAIAARHEESGIQLKEVANGYRFQTKPEFSPWLAKLWAERAPRYSRAFLETLAIIAYKQPITRAEIEDIRGVTVSSNIMKGLQEREWVNIIGYREVPGKPAIYGTTKKFLDHFSLKNLAEMPTLSEFRNLEAQEETLAQVQLALDNEENDPEENQPEENSVENPNE